MSSFVIPSFFSLIASSGRHTDFPVLVQMLSKAKVIDLSHENAYDLAYTALDAPSNASFNIAALKQLAETGQSPDSWSCCATPVVISPNRDHLDLARISGLDLSHDEATHFCEELNDYFKDDDFRFSFSHPGQWYCHVNNGFDVANASPFASVGDDIAAHIPHGAQGVMWRKIFNDVQMLLHHSATNHKRSQLGKPEINSLWFWGGDELIGKSSGGFELRKTIVSNDSFVVGLAKKGNAKVRAFPSKITINDMTDQDVFVADLEAPQLDALDENFFAPALQALKQGQIKEVVFYLDLNRKFILRRSDFLKFWRSNQSLLTFF